MPASVQAAIIAALIAAAVSVLIFAATQIISVAQRVGESRRARVDAVAAAFTAVILETRSPQVVRLWSKTQPRLLLAVTELVGSLPRRDRPLIDFLWYTTHRISGQEAVRRAELSTDGIAAIRVWYGSKGNGRSYMTARLIGAKQESLFGAKLYNVKLPRGVHRPRKFHRPLETRPEN
jgi:hypothetical protein